MKKYIGTKEVKAEPMTYGQAREKGFIHDDAFVQELSDCDGYYVVYSDGYESWTPADVFEAAYKIAEAPLDRINIEIANLREKGDKLAHFLHSDQAKELTLGTKAMLEAQEAMMGCYYNLLNLRQSCMEGGEDCKPYGLYFEQILPLLRNGYAVRRSGWNGKGLFVFKQVPAKIDGTIIPNMQSLPEEAKRLIMAHAGHIDYNAQCLIYNPETGRADSWVPSIADVFAYDWELVTE